ncbi:MAG: tRNA pseudouridine synthase A [Pseudomonadota bacterium]
MARLQLTIAYVGTHLHGWQIQQHANPSQKKELRTVQGELERIATKVAGVPVRLHGSGRTDSGVHAHGQIAHMDIPDTHINVQWQRAFNAQLPHDICVLDVEHVADDFHARYDATRKLYTYRLWCTRRFVPPHERDFVWAPGPLHVEAMVGAARHLMGTHDFASLQNAGTDIASTVRTMLDIRYQTVANVVTPACGDVELMAGAHELFMPALQSVTQPFCQHILADHPLSQGKSPFLDAPMELRWTFEADGFLKQMVRNIMGLLVAVGRGSLQPHDVPRILAACDRSASAVTAPACGLTMTKVYYGS